jgi:hypothetical protein
MQLTAIGRGAARLGLSTLAWACAASTWAATTPWPEMPTLPRTNLEWSLRDALVDGIPTRAQTFDSQLTTDEVLQFYSAHWSQLPGGPAHRKRVGEWETVSAAFGPFQMVVQVQEKRPAGSRGNISVMNMGEVQENWKPRSWPEWSDTDLVQVTETDDGPKHNQAVEMISRASLDVVAQRWRDDWGRRGYHIAHEQKLAADGQRCWIFLMDGEEVSLDATLTELSGGRVVAIHANRLTHNLRSER